MNIIRQIKTLEICKGFSREWLSASNVVVVVEWHKKDERLEIKFYLSEERFYACFSAMRGGFANKFIVFKRRGGKENFVVFSFQVLSPGPPALPLSIREHLVHVVLGDSVR